MSTVNLLQARYAPSPEGPWSEPDTTLAVTMKPRPWGDPIEHKTVLRGGEGWLQERVITVQLPPDDAAPSDQPHGERAGEPSDDAIGLLRATVARLDELHAKATPGPWHWDNAKGPDDWERENGITEPYVPQCSHLGNTMIGLDDTYENSRVDCALVAELRNAWPAISQALSRALGGAR